MLNQLGFLYMHPEILRKTILSYLNMHIPVLTCGLLYTILNKKGVKFIIEQHFDGFVIFA